MTHSFFFFSSLWCFLTASRPGGHSSAGLSVATAHRAKQHFTTMSVTSALHTNQRVCQRSTITEGKGKGRGGEMTMEREMGGRKKRKEKERQESVSHVASNFGSGSRTTLFHHGLLCYEQELARDRQETEELLNKQRPHSTRTQGHG